MLEIGLFGEPRFVFEGRPHPFTAPPKALPLLAYLLLQRNVRHLRENVAGLLWPDDDEESARTNLRRHIHYVRNALPPGEWVLADRASVRWNPDAPWRLDVADFEQQSKVPSLRESATTLYAGDLYNSCDEEWLYFERERLRNVQLANLSALSHEAERSRDHAAAATYARALLALDPWREDALRVLMRARMQNGDRAGALAEYERFRARLRDDMGVDPMDESTALYDAFCHERHASGAALPSANAAMVGRDSERDALLRLWRAARASRGGLVLLGGDAGVGKTTLLQSFVKDAQSEGALVLAGAASADAAVPYAPVAQAMAQLSKPANRSPFALEHASSVRLFGAVADALAAAAEKTPVLLTLEDLHWATTDAIALVEYLARTCRDLPVLIVATYRENDIGPQHALRALRRALTGRAWYAGIVLNPFDREASDVLIRRHLGDKFRAGVAENLYARTQGNAFFLRELLEQIAGGEGDAVPASIRGLVRQRIERLSAGAKRVARTLCATACSFDSAFVATVCSLPAREVDASLRELEDARFVTRVRDAAPVEYLFVHDIVRQALYEDIPEAELRPVHAAIAAYIEGERGREPASAPMLAFHFERAGDAGAAARAYAAAAEHAAAKFALEEAETNARKASALATDDATRIRALTMLASIYGRKGPPAARKTAVEELVELSERSEDPVLRCEALRFRIELAADDDVASLPDVVRRFAAVIPDAPLWKGRLKYYESMQYVLEGHEERARRNIEEARAYFGEAGYGYGQLYCDVRLLELAERHRRPYAEILERARELAAVTSAPDAAFLLDDAEAKLFLHRDRTAAQHAASRLLERACSVGDRGREAIAHAYLGAVDTYRFDIEPAREHFAAAQSLYEEGVLRPLEYAEFLRFRGLLNFATGDVRAGLDDSLEALRLARKEHAWQLVAVAAGNAAYGYRLCGDVASGTALGEEVAAQFGALEAEYFNLHHLLMELHVQYCEAGRFDEGLPVIRRAYELHEASGLHLHGAWIGAELALQLLRAGKTDEARQVVERVLDLLPAVLDEGWMPQEVLWRAALVFRACADTARAIELTNRAAALVGRRAAAIPGEEARQRYLQSGDNRAIMRAHAERLWPAPAC